MSRIPVVCLCDTYDLKAIFGPGFNAAAPKLELFRPDEIADPDAIHYGFALWPRPETIGRFPQLRLLNTPGAGVEGLLGNPAISSEIAVVRMLSPSQNRMMAGFASYHVVGWHRRLWEYPALQTNEEWDGLDRSPPDGFPVGILGFGAMGETIARALHTLGYPVTAWATRQRESDVARVLSGAAGFAEVMSTSRALINVLPLTDATREIFNAASLAMMPPDAMLLQIGRGGHLDQEALIAALDAGQPGLAVLDVTDPEPLPKGHPLWRHPRVRITPHVASLPSAEEIARHVLRSIAALESGGEIAGLVDLGRGY